MKMIIESISRALLLLIVLTVAYFGSIESAFATTGCPVFLGRCEYHGYFDNNHDGRTSTSDYLFSTGSTNGTASDNYSRSCSGVTKGNGGFAITDNSQFYTYLIGKYNGSNTQDRTAAAFIINTMLGRSGSAANRSISSADRTELQRRLRPYLNDTNADNRRMLINYCRSFAAGFPNSYYQTVHNDAAVYDNTSSETQLAISFQRRNSSTSSWEEIYVIKQNCGNPADRLGPLESQIPPVGDFATQGGSVCRVYGWAVDLDVTTPIDVVIREYLNDGNVSNDPLLGRITANRNNGYTNSTFGSAYSDAGFELYLPDRFKDGNTYTIHVGAVGVDGNGNVNQGVSLLPRETIRCDNINIFDLSTEVNKAPSGSNIPANNRVSPGDVIRIRATVSNSGPATATGAELQIQPVCGSTGCGSGIANGQNGRYAVRNEQAFGFGGSVSVNAYDAVWTNQTFSATNHYREATFSITNSAPDGQVICFRSRVRPISESSGSWDYSTNNPKSFCVTVYRNYQLSAEVIGLGGLADGDTVSPGQTLNIRAQVSNTGNLAATNASVELQPLCGGGTACGTGITNGQFGRYEVTPVSASGGSTTTYDAVWSGQTFNPGNHNRDASFTVNMDAPHDQLICFRSRVTPVSKTSSGWDYSTGNPKSLCVRVERTFDMSVGIIAGTVANNGVVQPGDHNIRARTVHTGNRDTSDFDVVTQMKVLINGDDNPAVVKQYIQANTDAPAPASSVSIIDNGTNFYGWRWIFNGSTNAFPEGNNNRVNTAPFTIIPDNLVVGDRICFQARVRPDNSTTNTGFSAFTSASGFCISITLDLVPHLRALGNDIHAGGGVSAAGPHNCSPNVAASNTISLTSGYTDQASLSLGQFVISAFDSISNIGSNNDYSSAALSLANYNTDSSWLCRMDLNRVPLLYTGGGSENSAFVSEMTSSGVSEIDYGGVSNAINNLEQAINGITASYPSGGSFIVIDDNSATRRRLGGDVTIPKNFKITLLFTGSVDITANVYMDNTYSSSDEVPAFAVVSLDGTDDSMRINYDVTNLFGFYYTRGTLDTCAETPSNIDIAASDTERAKCGNLLQVNGSLSAKDFKFKRTGFDTDGASNGVVYAEQITFIPELYISRPPLIDQLSRTNTQNSNTIQIEGERPPLL